LMYEHAYSTKSSINLNRNSWRASTHTNGSNEAEKESSKDTVA
jgi:hypothetical protein